MIFNKIVESANSKVDSLGNELSQEQIDFFKNSKIRDSKGNLLVCHHGTNKEFNTFDKNKMGMGGPLGIGFYFTTSTETSATFGAPKDVYLNITNPKIFTTEKQPRDFLIAMALEHKIVPKELRAQGKSLNRAVSEILQSEGYDGVFCTFTSTGEQWCVAYEPNQIKLVSNTAPTQKDSMKEDFDVLLEDIESMKKYYPNISDDDFQSYVELDPTYSEGSTQAGKYAKWILGLANKKQLDNVGHIKDVLSRFDGEKNNLIHKDIMKYKSVEELEAMLNDENSYKELSDRQRLRQTQKAVHNTDLDKDAEKVFDGKDWEVWIPHTYEASCKLGRNTQWCTASTESDHYYNSYTKNGNLYIIINKHNGEKYQFHFESASFMDAEDESIYLAKFLLDNRELNDYFYANLPDEIKEQIDDLKELADNDYVFVYHGDIPQKMKHVFRYIEKIIVERDITKIPDKEFHKLIGLKEVSLHDNITYIGESAFEDCENLEYINLPHNLEHLGDYAFDGCVRLKSIKINSELQMLPMFAFSYTDAKRVEVPGNINVISNGAFCNTELQTVVLNEGVQVISSHAFSGSDKLTSIKLPHSLNKIDSRAFRNCTSLQKIVIPKEVEYMGHRVFGNCPNLTVYCEAEEQPIRWETDWNHRAEVVWGYKGEEVKESYQMRFKLMNESLTIDDVNSPEQLMTWMNDNITYELVDDEYSNSNGIPTKTAEEVLETKTGHCAEQSYLEQEVLDGLGYESFFVMVKENNSEKEYGAEGSAHLFLVYKDEDARYCWFEHSMQHSRGIHKYDTLEELLKDVAQQWWRYDENSDILEVRFIDKHITGVDNWGLAKECYKYPVEYTFDISNNVLEKDVPPDAEWDFDNKKVLGESLSTKIVRRDNPNDFSPFGYKVDFYDGDTHIGEGSVCGIKDDNAFLYDFEVYPEHRGKGYSKEMLQFMIDKYDLKQLYVQQDNTVAVNLYKKFGFKVEGEVEDDGKPAYDMIRESYKMKFKLTEGKNLEQTVQQYIDKYKKIVPAADDDLHRSQVMGLIAIDPTYKEGSNTTGDYAIWILNLAIKNGWDVISTKEKLLPLLTDFIDKKSSLKNKDINSYKSAEELEIALKNCTLTDRQKERRARNATSMIEKVLSTNSWDVYRALNWEGALTLGKGTTWCTADSDNAGWYCKYITDTWYDDASDAFEIKDYAKMHFKLEELIDVLKRDCEVESLEEAYERYSDRAVLLWDGYNGILCNPYDKLDDNSYPYNNLFVFINKHTGGKYQFCMSEDLSETEDDLDYAITFCDAMDRSISFRDFIGYQEKELRAFWEDVMGYSMQELFAVDPDEEDEEDIEESYSMRFKLNGGMEHRYYLCGNYGLVGTPYPNPVTREEAERNLSSGHLLSSWGYVHEKSTWDDGIRRCVSSYTKLLTTPEDFDKIEQQMEKHYGKSAVTENVLNEDIAAVRQNFPSISDKDFDRVIRLDPTFNPDKDSVGTYGKWLLNLFKKGNLSNEGHVTDVLKRFEQVKKNLKNKDIGQFKSLEEIDTYLNDNENYKSLSNRQITRQNQVARRNADLGKDASLVFETPNWEVWVPHTYAASCKLGQGSHWCTASTESEYYYNSYSRSGNLYININKSNRDEKYQFHFETSSFMDKDDSSISLKDFCKKNSDLKEFYYPIVAKIFGVDTQSPEHALQIDITSGEFKDVLYDWKENYATRNSLDAKTITTILDGDAWDIFYYDDVTLHHSSELPSLSDDVMEKLVGIEVTIENIEELIDNHSDDFPYSDEIDEALQFATAEATFVGTESEAYNDILYSMVKGAEKGIDYTVEHGVLTISTTTDALLETIMDKLDEGYDIPSVLPSDRYSDADNILIDKWESDFTIYEPQYGWYGFDNEVFNEAFLDKLNELIP